MQEEVLMFVYPSRKSVKVLALIIRMIKKRQMPITSIGDHVVFSHIF